MIYHILNGDAMIDRFRVTGLKGECLVAREAFISGPLEGNTLSVFFANRAQYFTEEGDNADDYYALVVSQFNALQRLPASAEINLWFGYDLFCRVNSWFILSLLHERAVTKSVYIIHPTHLKRDEIWRDYGGATPNHLLKCYQDRVLLSSADIYFGKLLWNAFRQHNLAALKRLAQEDRPAFPYLQEVVQAHIERFPEPGKKSRPMQTVQTIIEEKQSSDFSQVFQEFFKREGVYGFGDTQFREVYNDALRAR